MDTQLFNELNSKDIIIFDFDGTLINSEPCHKEAHNVVLREYLHNPSFSLTEQDFARYMGKKDPEIFEMYKDDFHVEYDSQIAIAKKLTASKTMLIDSNTQIFDYFFDLAQNKGDKKFYIVSNQMQEFLMDILDQKGITKYFDKIYCLGSMNLTKQEFYQDPNKYIPIKNKTVAMLEDSNESLLWGKQNGFLTVGVESDFNRGRLTNAEYIIKY